MKILISNDDGVRATGINFLNEELSLNHETFVVAPDKERSSCGHGITLGEPIRLDQIHENIYACSGLPADCILIGVGQLLKNNKPDLIVSGINHGANLGQDRYYSGTMAAAREGVLRGIPSIAVSLVTKAIKDVEHYDVAAKIIKILIDHKVHEHIPKMGLVNVNVPNVALEKLAGIKITLPGWQDYSEEVIERVDGRGKKYYWVGGTYRGHHSIDGSDCNAVAENFVSVNLQDVSGSNFISNHDQQEFEKEVNKISWEKYLTL